MTRSHIAALVSGLALALAVGCSGGSSGGSDKSQASNDTSVPAGLFGCSNALIRQQQAQCDVTCGSYGFASLGVKYCATDDPSGQAGNVEAPCDCDQSPDLGRSSPDLGLACGSAGQECCVGNICSGESLCNASGACVIPCTQDTDCTGGFVCTNSECHAP